jgi:hypothetical protein
MVVFGHHADGFFQMEIMGREFPNGMTEHALAFGATAVVLALVAYGAYAVLRDARRWLARRRTHLTSAARATDIS